MSDNFGFKIGVEGEKEFKNALRDINRSFKVLGSEMNLVTSQFDKQDKSVKAITARNTVLNKEIDAQKNKVGTLEAALKNSAESFGENDKRTQAWQIQLNHANADLNKMERELDGNNKALDEAGDGFDDAGTEADKFGEEIKETAKITDDADSKFEKLGSVMKGVAVGIGVAMAAIGTAAVSAGKKLYDMANDSAAAGDEIDKASQRIGLSKTGYQEWDYILSQNGASISSLENGMKKLNNTVDDSIHGSSSATEKFNRLGISMEDLQGKSREEIFEMTVSGLQGIADEGEKAAIANDLLGTSSVELGALLNQTAESTEELKNKASELGLVMSDESIGAAANYTDAMDNLTRSFAGVKNNITAQILPGFTMILDGFTGLITGQEGAAEKLKEGAEETVSQIAMILPQILDVITGLIVAIAAVAPDLIIALVNGILDNLPSLIDAASNIIMTIVGGLIEGLPQITNGALELVLALVDGIISNLPALVEAALVMIVTLATGLGDSLPELIPSIVEAVVLIVTVLLDNMDKVIEAAFKIIEGLAKGLMDALPKMIESLPRIITTIVDFITNNLPLIVQLGIALTIELAAGLIRAVPQLVASLPEIVEAIITGIGKAALSIVEVGKNIVLGLWDGIDSMVTWVKDKIGGFVSNIIGGIKGLLGIKSPSTVFAEMGTNMALGMGEGFDKNMVNVEKGMENNIPTDFEATWNKLSDNAVKSWSKIVTNAKEIWTKLQEFFKGNWKETSDSFSSIWNTTKALAENIWSGIRSIASTVWTAMSDYFMKNFNDVKVGFEKTWGDISRISNSVWQGIKTSAIGIWTAISDFFTSSWRGVKVSFESIWYGIRDIFINIWTGLQSTATVLITGVVNNMKAAFNIDWWSVGRNIIDGITSGVMDAAKSLARAVANAAKSALDAAKSALGINSPSSVFRDEVGLQVGAGFAEGIDKSRQNLLESMNDLVNGLKAEAQLNITGLDMELKDGAYGSREGIGAGGLTQNITIISPKALSERELAREFQNTSRKLAMGVI